MPANVRIPEHAVTEFDLPAVCVVTGATEGVSYHRVSFSFVPFWARFSVVLCGLLGLVFILISTRRMALELAFTDDAYKKYRTARLVPGVLIIGALPLLLLALISDSYMMMGGIAFLAAVVAAVAYAVAVLPTSGPACKSIDEDGSILLQLPSAEAAEAIERRLAPRHAEEAAGSERDRYDDAIDAELALLD